MKEVRPGTIKQAPELIEQRALLESVTCYSCSAQRCEATRQGVWNQTTLALIWEVSVETINFTL